MHLEEHPRTTPPIDTEPLAFQLPDNLWEGDLNYIPVENVSNGVCNREISRCKVDFTLTKTSANFPNLLESTRLDMSHLNVNSDQS